jgi:hypothetical protein
MGKKLGLVMAVVVIASSISGCSVAQPPSASGSGSAAIDVPAGIQESQWRPLGQDLGMVIQGVEAGRTVGYFMYKVDGKWLPLLIQNPASVLPAN